MLIFIERYSLYDTYQYGFIIKMTQNGKQITKNVGFESDQFNLQLRISTRLIPMTAVIFNACLEH